MNYLKSLFLSSLLIAGNVTQAQSSLTDTKPSQSFTSETLETAAIQFLNNRAMLLQRPAEDYFIKEVVLEGTDVIRAYNIGNDNGFVIVANDNSDEPFVIGYADQGQIDNTAMPPQLSAWISSFSKALDRDRQLNIKRSTVQRKTVKTHPVVLPLLSVQWGQTYPYNLFCPNNYPTGCVATAMAQVMAYYQWPRSFEWDKMSVCYTAYKTEDGDISFESPEACEAVARLMSACGTAVNMDYKPDASTASSSLVPKAFITSFGYDNNAKMVSRASYTMEGWETLICHELQEGRPIIFGGFNPNSEGHQFVVDGVNADGYYHINWGWGGLSNGYYLLMDMTPSAQGTGGGNGYDGYTMDIQAIIGIQPPKGNDETPLPEATPMMTVTSMGIYAEDEFERNTLTKFFSNVQITFEVSNITTLSFDTEMALLMLDDDNNIVGGPVSGMPIFQTTRSNCFSGAVFGRNTYLNLTFGRNLKDGHYRIVSVFRLEENEDWVLDEGSNKHYLDAIVTGNKLKLISHPLSELHVNNVKFLGTQSKGSLQVVKVSIENTGEDFCDNLFLFVNGEIVSGVGTLISAGQMTDVYFRYVPMATGNNVLSISQSTSGSNPFYSGTFIISENKTPVLEISDLVINNLDEDNNFYGHILNGSFVITNTSDVDYSDKVRPTLYKLIENVGVGISCDEIDCVVPANQSVCYDFNINDLLEYGFSYSIGIDHFVGTKVFRGDVSMPFTPTRGVSEWLPDGNYYSRPLEEILAVDEKVVAMEISVPEVSDVIINDNPNTLYYLEKDAIVPKALEKSICILDRHCSDEVILTDEHAFYAPYSFTCPLATFTHIPKKTITATGENFETIMLPFDVESIQTETGQNLIVSGTDANIWLYEFAGEDGDKLLFERTDQLLANRPYLIGYINLDNKKIRFVSGQKALIHSSTQRSAQIGNRYCFSPVSSFHPAITDSFGQITNSWSVELNEKPTGQGVDSPEYVCISDSNAVYDLLGRKLSTIRKSGCYIIGGKVSRKMIVK